MKAFHLKLRLVRAGLTSPIQEQKHEKPRQQRRYSTSTVFLGSANQRRSNNQINQSIMPIKG
jgi:hypothetical protein